MIVETAHITVTEGQQAGFETALAAAIKVLSQARGFVGIEVHVGVERPAVFLLNIHWQTLADHTVGFRESDLFTQWRAIIGPYFAEPAVVEHWERLTLGQPG